MVIVTGGAPAFFFASSQPEVGGRGALPSGCLSAKIGCKTVKAFLPMRADDKTYRLGKRWKEKKKEIKRYINEGKKAENGKTKINKRRGLGLD
jgi:hypothetical protein